MKKTFFLLKSDVGVFRPTDIDLLHLCTHLRGYICSQISSFARLYSFIYERIFISEKVDECTQESIKT